jgi:DNA-binding CsgD family transcriptional regulator
LLHARRLRDCEEIVIGGQSLSFISAEAEDRRSAALPGETTQIGKDGRSAPQTGASLCELIVAGAGGEILEGEKAARWFFGKTLERPSETARALLPAPVRAWLKRQGSEVPPGGTVLELPEADRRVIVTLCRRNKDRCFLLVREDSAHAVVARLKSLGLSPREAEVMHWVGEGKTNPEIAGILKVTIYTVNRHLEHILAKLGVENRQKAIVTVLEKLNA